MSLYINPVIPSDSQPAKNLGPWPQPL